METVSAAAAAESFPMNGGDSTYSYTNNSSYQRGGAQKVKEMIDEAIAEKLDIPKVASPSPFTVADYGCSTGPNTFIMVHDVVEAVERKYKTHCPNSDIPEFQVYFNDHVSNDFDTLFESLPPNKNYFAAGVPGSFRTKVFPKASINFVNTSYSLHWMSKVPNAVLDRKSLAWNKGRISYGNAPKEVVEAYSTQFAEDIELFLDARAQELVPGGLMAIVLLGITDEVPPSQSTLLTFFDIMGSTLMDMTKLGVLKTRPNDQVTKWKVYGQANDTANTLWFVSEDEVDSFKLPIYNTTQKELKSLIEKNGHFNIEKVEPLARPIPSPELSTMHFRATCEGVFKEHFSTEIIDVFFPRFTKKVAVSSTRFDYSGRQANDIFVLLKRKC